MDPRTITLGTDRWLTDSRVYNLVWLGRWIERAQTVSRVLQWAVERGGSNAEPAPRLDEVAEMATSVLGVSTAPDESALDALLTLDGGASLRGCLAARTVQCDSGRADRGDSEHRRHDPETR